MADRVEIDVSKTSRRRCIFCGGPGSSPEHIWSRWLIEGGHVQVKDRLFHQSVDSIRGRVSYRDITRTHGIYSTEVSCVCRPCNTRWMSDIDNQAKASLVPLVEGRELALDMDDQSHIASWATLKAMALECSNPATRSIAQWQRSYLMKYRRPPRGVSVNLAAHVGVGERGKHYVHRLYSIDIADPTGLPSRWIKPDGVLTSFVVGHLALQVAFYTGPYDRTPQFGAISDDAVVCIWPPLLSHDIEWPPRIVLDDEAFAKFSVDDFGLGG